MTNCLDFIPESFQFGFDIHGTPALESIYKPINCSMVCGVRRGKIQMLIPNPPKLRNVDPLVYLSQTFVPHDASSQSWAKIMLLYTPTLAFQVSPVDLKLMDKSNIKEGGCLANNVEFIVGDYEFSIHWYHTDQPYDIKQIETLIGSGLEPNADLKTRETGCLLKATHSKQLIPIWDCLKVDGDLVFDAFYDMYLGSIADLDQLMNQLPQWFHTPMTLKRVQERLPLLKQSKKQPKSKQTTEKSKSHLDWSGFDVLAQAVGEISKKESQPPIKRIVLRQRQPSGQKPVEKRKKETAGSKKLKKEPMMIRFKIDIEEPVNARSFINSLKTPIAPSIEITSYTQMFKQHWQDSTSDAFKKSLSGTILKTLSKYTVQMKSMLIYFLELFDHYYGEGDKPVSQLESILVSNDRYHCFWYQCENNAGNGFSTQKEALDHLKEHQPSPNDCPVCYSKFPTFDQLTKHSCQQLMDPLDYVCNICGAGVLMMSPYMLMQHILTSSCLQQSIDGMECPFCHSCLDLKGYPSLQEQWQAHWRICVLSRQKCHCQHLLIRHFEKCSSCECSSFRANEG
ncbi:hypothetical protein EDD86DRAFT_200270 [Gorgonomyces haynaldii]|nr:hypothetical protein EDD86DRAFT_200270 [Gorgonomyces haynaldii]